LVRTSLAGIQGKNKQAVYTDKDSTFTHSIQTDMEMAIRGLVACKGLLHYWYSQLEIISKLLSLGVEM
jgi:hypothetical protein